MPKTDPDPPKTGRKQERDARLAEALRENLKKRKAQARERALENDGGPPESDV